jgi:MT0933-like antitoxin protein
MSGFFDEAKELADSHEKQVDEGMEKIAQEVDERTGNKYDNQIDSGVRAAEKHVGDGNPGNN